MTLKQKSLLISLGTTITFLLIVIAVVYRIIAVQFQQLENQRTERNIRRISAVLDDRFAQLASKLTDWTNWDDTYYFLQDTNKQYIESNLIPESFHNIGVDEALFINKEGDLVASILSTNEHEPDFPENLYSYFATGSALLKMNKDTLHNQGIIKTDDGILLFAVREVYRSDQSGPTMGAIVFARYLDEKILNSLKDLTQFEASMYLWDDPNLPPDFHTAKSAYNNQNTKELTQTLDKNTISGYLIIEDIDGKPQAIVRSDITRDITLQGKSSMILLLVLLIVVGFLTGVVNYWLLTGGVLRKISLIAKDVDTLAHKEGSTTHLTIGNTSDEVDILRVEINDMIDSIQKSKSELTTEKSKSESLIDLINAIIVSIDPNGIVISINKVGAETLGFNEEDIIGKNWFDNFVSPSSREGVRQKFSEIISGNIDKHSHMDTEVTTREGKTLMISWHNTLVKDTAGKAISTLSLGEDITFEKTEEIKKEAYAKELERLNDLMVNRELKMIELKKQLEKDKKA